MPGFIEVIIRRRQRGRPSRRRVMRVELREGITVEIGGLTPKRWASERHGVIRRAS